MTVSSPIRMSRVSGSWFIVLPDVDKARSVASALCTQAPQLVEHVSGQPWIVGQWTADEMTLATVGRVRVAVIGCCPITATRLSALLADVHRVADLDQPIRALPGCFHLVASVDGEVRVQGSISALRQVSYARIAGLTVAADNVQVLVSSTGAAIDDRLIAARMAYPQLPYPLDDQCLWQGVQNLPPDCYLVLDGEGRSRVLRRWSPPAPVLPLVEGAVAVRQALTDAIAARTAGERIISADLSGGMDSTSLCFLAAPRADLLTVRRVEADPGSDDDLWARRAATELPSAEHVVFGHDEAPPIYAASASVEEGTEGPYRWIRTRGRHVHLARLLVERGCRLHLTGHGGDELFGAFPSYLHALARSHPRIATKHMRGYRALRRWSTWSTLRAVSDSTTFPAWLAASADQLTAPPPAPTVPHLGWGWPVRMPPWATPTAVEAARGLLRDKATEMPAPLAHPRVQHEVLQYIRACGRAVRQVAMLASDVGTQLAAPYLDDRVIEAALAVRLHERMTPWRYKPLLAAAMRDIVPDEILGRTTKGDFTADVYAGLRRHRAGLLELFEDSALAQRGLIDTDALRATILGVHPTFTTLIPLEQTVACEVWLRAAACTPQHAPGELTGESPWR
ncbi:MAG: asparagine synthase-related protein [Pseudonocardiaceae bacterium]